MSDNENYDVPLRGLGAGLAALATQPHIPFRPASRNKAFIPLAGGVLNKD
jgi:hypothetical protein